MKTLTKQTSEIEGENYQMVKKFALKWGASLFGVADILPLKKEFFLPEKLIENITRGISLGFRLSDKILEGIKDKPTHLYYHHYRQANFFLDRLALKVASFIQDKGWESLPIPASQIIDWKKQRGHLSHKKIAQRAGLGWLGRNNLLVTPAFGARVRLVSILTDMPLRCDTPMEYSCKNCRNCLSVCPAEAIKEDPGEFEHLKCFEQLKLFRKLGYTSQYICGICVKACQEKAGLKD